MTRFRGFLILVAALAVVPVAACGPTAAERCASAKNVTECMGVANAGGDVGDYLTYGMAGYMLSSMVNGSGQRQQVIVADPSYHGYRRPISSYQDSVGRMRRSTVTTTTTKRGVFGGTKTTTRTTSWTSRPSYRSSYRSGRR